MPRQGRKNLSPLRGSSGRIYKNHGLRPWLRSVAAPRLNKGAATPRYSLLTKPIRQADEEYVIRTGREKARSIVTQGKHAGVGEILTILRPHQIER